ncbi:hypothetical protein [Rhodococcoides yunnanense]|uniref:hypothetical protein n=1 Tax=Rhodococcoides yunnanense TaxID=278209 RepID=UPI000934E7A2|nr:hypothetical protein [Rhodococcus yunnanensis]
MNASANAASDEVRNAAWGSTPGLWPLPTVTEPLARWHRAVALGGQGRYSLGAAELDVLERGLPPGHVLGSLAASTRASWLRQMGRHTVAARFDGAALTRTGQAGSELFLEAGCDAFVGLAADALGSGSFGSASALLGRAGRLLAEHDDRERLWRPALRLRWVSAELAMLSGDGPASVRHALDAREEATDTVSLRHRIKTDLIVAAAHSSVGDVDRAAGLARTVLDACSEHGLVPLRWAAAMLLNGLGEVTEPPSVVADSSAVLARRGGIVAGA